jgi:multidrug efflux pump subunit AcrA (membrane-fusion protein)
MATAEPDRATVQVQRGDLLDELVLRGQVTPIVQQDLAFAQNGIVRRLLVQAGAQVKTGQLLAELDLGTLPQELEAARITLGQDQAALNQSTQSGQLAVRRAEIALAEAQARLAKVQTPPAPEEIAKARAALQQAEAALARTRNDASALKTKAELAYWQAVADRDRVKTRYEAAAQALQNNPTSGVAQQQATELEAALRAAEETVARLKIEFDTAANNEKAGVQSAEAAVDLARAALDALLKGPDAFAVADARRAVQLAQVALDEARQQLRANPLTVKAIASSQLSVQKLEQEIESRRVYAPFEGSILAVEARAGFMVEAEAPLIRMMDGSGLHIVVSNISPTDQERLLTGMNVLISLNRYSNQTIPGSIKAISQAGRGTNSTGSVQIGLDTSNLQGIDLILGDPARIVIDFGRKQNALWLPPDAIRRDSGAYVLVPDGSGERRVDIQTGIVNSDRVEIVQGLNVNDVVIVR